MVPQGAAQAQNLRDSGCRVVIGQRPGSPNFDLARKHGFEPISIEEAARRGDLIAMLLPDEVQADVYRDQILPHLTAGKLLVFAHGFNVHYGQIAAPAGVDMALVAPKGVGPMVRSEYVRGGGVPCLLAMSPGAADLSKRLALAYARGIGCTRAGAIESSFAEETEADLFSEQAVLCGGVSALVKAAYETLVEAGYQPEAAYFECLHELKLIVDLLHQGGFSYMHECISNTAEFGEYTRGPRIVTDATRAEMRRMLAEVRGGEFARQWLAESKAGCPTLKAQREAERRHPIEEIGRRMRRLMPWIEPKED